MANIKSAKKRARQDVKRNLKNSYFRTTTRTMVKNLRKMKDKDEAMAYLPLVISKVDSMVSKGIYHRNKANNLKSKLTIYVSSL